VYYVLFIFVVITALNQAGVDTGIITSNVTLILGSILLAFAISYGFASRNLVGNLLSSYYGKGKYQEGQTIRVGDVQGEIVKIDSISITLKTADSKVVLPSKMLVEGQVEILDEGTTE
jgi:small-conductance mechanosensitive channel